MPPKASSRPSNFVSDQHVLFCGWVLGHMVRSGLPFEPVRDADGNYTNRVNVTTPEGVVFTLIIPPPPDDWKFTPGAES